MIIANHLVKNLTIADLDYKLNCGLQSKRVLGDLLRLNQNKDAAVTYPLLMQVYLENFTPCNPAVSSTSSVVMEVVNPHDPVSKIKDSFQFQIL